jgi:hypothetical protein
VKRALFASVVVVVLAVAAVAAVPLIEQRAADRIKAQMEADGMTRVASVEVELFARSVALSDLRSRRVGDITIRHWRASGLSWPLGELLRGRIPLSGWRLGDPLRADRVELHDLKIADADGARWSVGSLVFEGFDLAPYDGEIEPGPDRAMVLGARVLQALSLRRLEERDVTYTAGHGGPTVSIDSFVLDGLDNGVVGSFALTNFESRERTAGEPIFRLSDLEGKRIDFSRIVSAVSSADWEPGAPRGRLEVESLSASGFGGSLLAHHGASLDAITYQSERRGAGRLRWQTRVAGFVLRPAQHGQESLPARMIMQSMGLDELKLEFDCSGVGDRTKGELTVDRCALAGPGLGELDVAFTLVQPDEPFWRALNEGEPGFLYDSKVGLGAARLVIADKGLLDRTLRAIAATTGQPTAATRAELAREVRRFQPTGVLITEDMTKLLDTVARFIERGGILTISARPDPPFGLDRLSYLASPGPDLVEVLGLSATLSR